MILTLLVFCCEWSNNPPAAEAFVTPRQPPVNVGAPGRGGARAAGATANEINSRGAGGRWRTTDHLPRRRRSRETGGGGGGSERYGCGQGVRSLRAGLGFPPLPGSELVDFMATQLVEQSVKHHWQSGFIGGSVGVMGTLTAIQVCVCLCVCARSISSPALVCASRPSSNHLYVCACITLIAGRPLTNPIDTAMTQPLPCVCLLLPSSYDTTTHVSIVHRYQISYTSYCCSS